ncbi:porin family protein [Desulfogranum japonicum]|uniref:hypothetical protein n=1 Tax=Desulfogranum japonicum TaxID=231447 RepID=UPI0003F816A8|nr:hypothetical protein [Desulfogranum japonicum]
MQKHIYPLMALSLLVGSPAMARQTIISGSVHTGVDYWERNYDDDAQENATADDGDKRQIGIGPDIIIVSESIRDSLSFRYAPIIKYDDTNDETDIDHYLSLAATRMLSQRWAVKVNNDFRLSDDPYFSAEEFADTSSVITEDMESDSPASEGEDASQQESEVSQSDVDELSKDNGRSRYWTNNLALKTEYIFSERTLLELGYAFSVLRNESSDDDAYDEYDRHAFSANATYAFNRKWATSLAGMYSRGLFDDAENPEDGSLISDDLDSYRFLYRLAYEPNAKDSYPFLYDFRTTKYENDYRRDTLAHNVSMGWNHAFNQRTQMKLGGGPSYAEAEDLDGEWGYNAYFNLSRTYEHAQLSLSLNKRYDTQNFTGNGDSGLKDTFDAQLRFQQQLTQALGFNVYGKYKWESNLDPQDEYLDAVNRNDISDEESTGDVTYDKNTYEMGVGFDYAFWRYYSVGVKYAYFVSDGDLSSDQYNDHRVMLTLSAAKDLWRW